MSKILAMNVEIYLMVCFKPICPPVLAVLFVLIDSCFLAAETVEGFAEPYLTVEISATEPGVFIDIPVSMGDRVKAGQVIASLDSEILRASLAIAEHRAASQAVLLKAEAELEWQQKTFEQYKQLRERGSCSEIEFRKAEADLRRAKANVMQAQEQRRLAELERDRIATQIEKRRIRTPISGIVSEVNREVGEAHFPADPRVLTIVQLENLKVRFSVTPAQGYFIKGEKELSVVFPETSERAKGVVQSISPLIDAKSGTLQVTVVLENRAGKFSSGARCLIDLSARFDEANRNLGDSERSR